MAQIKAEISVIDIDIVRRLLAVLVENAEDLPEPVLIALEALANESEVYKHGGS